MTTPHLYSALYHPINKTIEMVFRNDAVGQIIHPSHIILSDWMEQWDLINFFYELGFAQEELIKIEEFDPFAK